jgi:nucleoid DNA-binding protein
VEVFAKPWYTHSMSQTDTQNVENTAVETEANTTPVTVSKDTWVRALALRQESSQKVAESWFNAFRDVFGGLVAAHTKIPVPGMGTFTVREYSAPSVAPLSKEEKASGMTVAEKRAGAPLVHRRKVVFSMSAAIDRALNNDTTDTAEAVA